MKNRIYINNDQKLIPVTEEYKKIIKKTVNAALRYEKAAFSAEVSVTFVDNEKIHELNLAHRGKDSATDVLSFPLFEKDSFPTEGSEQEYIPIGDVVISLEKAREQAQEYGHSFEREIAFLTVHSILHLVGYDHEVNVEDEKYMNETCEAVLEKLGLTRDYLPEEEQDEEEEDEEEDAVVISREDMKTGFICILGRPNVGKSTLMNTILGEKVAIVSKKPQTTRNKITGVYTKGCEQFVFIDTPGIHKPKNKLGEYMMKEAGDSVVGTDAVVFIVEPTEKPSKVEQEIAQKINSMKVPAILVINKADAFKKTKILTTIDNFSKLCDFSSIVPISALENDGVDIVLEELRPYLKNEPWFFEADMITDQPIRQIAAEVIREKLLRTLDDEIPHGVAVVIEEFEEKPKIINIRAELFCEKEAHKRIIIGKNGEALKKVGSFAREDLEKLFEKKIYLDLWVKVRENWRDSMLNLNRLGFKGDN
ncbi:MAG: GTPase Era [Ruminococcaceae bacterium]|nr:GTPase Era [Oscillospiraceae bacterium]